MFFIVVYCISVYCFSVINGNHMFGSGDFWAKSPLWFLKIFKLPLFYSGNFKTFKNTIEQFIPNRPHKHVITSNNTIKDNTIKYNTIKWKGFKLLVFEYLSLIGKRFYDFLLKPIYDIVCPYRISSKLLVKYKKPLRILYRIR